MRSIKKFLNESDFEIYQLNDGEFVQFLKDNAADISEGFRLYAGSASKETDITLKKQELYDAKDIVMLRPAKGPETWIPILVATLISTAISLIISATIDSPDAGNRKQSSATNSFGERENKINLGGRVDDPWGFNAAFVPSLIQQPYSRYEDNVEVENFAGAIMKKLFKENFKDGDTKFELIPNAKLNFWDPSSDLSSAPDQIIGGEILLADNSINSITSSAELQSQELLPPNDLDIGGVPVWEVESLVGSAIFTLANAETLEVDLNEYFAVGQESKVIGCRVPTSLSSVEYYTSTGVPSQPSVSNTFTVILSFTDMDGAYPITSVTTDKVTIDTSSESLPLFPQTRLLSGIYSVTDSISTKDIEEKLISERDWYEEGSLTTLVQFNGGAELSPIFGPAFDQSVGPIRIKRNTNNIIINLVASNGFLNFYKNNEQEFTADIEFLIEELDDNGVPTGNDYNLNVDFSTNENSKTKQSAKTVDINNTLAGGVINYAEAQITARRITSRIKDDNYQNQDKVNWQNLYFEEYVDNPVNADMTIFKAQLPSSPSARSVKKRLINFDVTPIFQPYERGGTFGAERPVSTWAETLVALALDKYNGRLTLDNVDAETYLDVQDAIISYYGFPEAAQIGYNFDSTKIRFQEQYKTLCEALNIKAYAQGGVFKAYADINRTDSSKQFTHRYKIDGSDSKSSPKTNEFDGVELTYRSGKDGKFDTIIRHVNGADSYNRKQIELSGCTSEKVATIRTNRELNIIKHQRYSFSFDADGIANLTIPGERVDNVDYTRIVKRPNNMNNYAIYAGYVVNVINGGLTVELSEPVYFEDGQEHSIRFADQKGNLMASIACSKGPSANHVILSVEPETPLYIGYKAERTSFTFAADSDRASLPVIIRSIKAKDIKGIKAKTISAIDYNVNYYKDDHEFKEA